MTFDNLSIILKLVSGETLLCQVIDDTDKNMIIRDPYEIRVHSVATDDGIRAMTYYSDWFLGSKSRIHMIRKEHVMSASLPNDQLQGEYVKMISSRDENPDKHSDAASSKPKFNWDDLNFKPDNGSDDRN